MASNSILKLQVDDKQYEASLKSAQQGLQALMNALRNSGKSFSDLDKNTEKYVRALGNMEATAKTTRGRIGEMSSAFVELSQVEKQLTDQERQSPVGKALTESLNQLKQRTIEAKQELADLDKQLTSQKAPTTTGGMFSGLGSKMEGALAVFGGNMMTAAAGAVANLGAEMADMVKQGVEMAKAGEGVRIAFERLGNGRILDGLREATHGTVTDLELMKAAVKFNDFKLPVEELGTMLAFAQQKAKDTGQSVDYMVDSIVTGLGRKSLMILDNLGLSAAEIKDKMKDTGDMTKAVGAIIRDQMAKAGDYVETAADRAAQANVNMQNKMEELGRKFAPLQEASNSLWTSMKIGILDVIGGPLTDLLNKLTEAGRLKNALNNINGDGTKGSTVVANQLKQLQAAKMSGASQYMLNTMQSGVIEGYNRQINEREQAIKDWNAWRRGSRSEGLQERIGKWRDKYGTDVNSIKAEADAYRTMIAEYRKGAKDIMTPVTVDVKTDNAVKSLDELKVKLSELQAQRKKVAAGSDEAKRLDTEIRQVKADIKLQDPNALKTTTTKLDEIQKIQKKINDLTNEAYTADESRVEEIKAEIAGLQEEERRLTAIRDLVTNKNNDPLKALESQFPDMSKQNYNTDYAGSAQAKYDSARADLALGPMNLDAVNTYIGSVKGMLKDANLGDELYNSMTEKLKDATTVSTLLQEMMERGLAGADLERTAQALKEKMLSPEGIDQTAIQSFLEGLNKQIEESGGVGLKLNADTGEVTDKKGKDDGEELKKFNEGVGKLTGGLSQVTGGLKAIGIELPKEVDQVLGVINGVSQIISGVGTIISIFGTTAVTANTTAVGLNTAAIAGLIAAIEVNTATNIIPFFAGGGIVPAFAQGGLIGRAAGGLMIPGNSMSGDRLRLPVDGGLGMIGVNSGELILNRAQQGNLASQLEGGSMQNLNIDWVLTGDKLRAVLNNNGRRTGRGELVQRNRI